MKLMDQDDISKEQEKDCIEQKKENSSRKGFQPNATTVILLGIIIVLLAVIFVLLIFNPVKKSSSESVSMVEQDIMDYARQQQEKEPVKETGNEVIVVETRDLPEQSENGSAVIPQVSGPDSTEFAVIGEEDKNDISYTKEYILNEMAPYFADNNLEAIWDLAHLKRYINLSEGLEGTNTFYYQGDLDKDGKPHGRGLAIYEANSYYYGSWVHGLREGDGRWYRFYIDESDEVTLNQMYQAHSYSGNWKNDLPNGEGAEHYDVKDDWTGDQSMVITNVVGGFSDGLYDGEMYANTIDYTGGVKEWDAVAGKGVFKLWRTMSSKGECSVWRSRSDNNQYIEIDKSENKNQGITELLDL